MSVLGLLWVCCVWSCGGSTVACVPGDQIQCRCGDGSYGYRTCGPQGDAGADYGHCDCVVGLAPAPVGVLVSPYMSGVGTGRTDAGTR